jgi:hypothetical protein
LRQFGKSGLHSVAPNHDDFINARRVVETLPGMRDDGSPRDFEKKLIPAQAHAGALAGGDDDGTVHGAESRGGDWLAKGESGGRRRTGRN